MRLMADDGGFGLEPWHCDCSGRSLSLGIRAGQQRER